jgi:ubiquinone/menaquinone biosynthesis C-methylase UbiE
MPLATEAQTGFASAAAYDKSRPSYTPTVVESLLKSLEVSGVQQARIVDVGAGTGKFTELLAARPEQYEIIAVEPHDGMRAELERKQLKGVKVVKGTADDMPDVKSGSAAAVTVAQVSMSDVC